MDDGAVIPSPDGDRRAVGMSGQGRPAPGGLEILTARLHLQPVGPEDLEELFALHADPRAFAEDLTAPLTDREQMRWVLGRWRESWERHGVGYLTVRAREAVDGSPTDDLPIPTPGLLGVVGLSPLDLEDGPALSAYWRLSPAATGHGIATEAMQAVLASPQLTAPGLDGRGDEIVAVTAAGNHASRALAARLGFSLAPPERPVPGGREGDVLLVRAGSSPTGSSRAGS